MKLFDGIIISKIDLDKTTQNGKNICDLYQPLVEKRLKQAKNTPFNSASFVMFSGNQKGGNSSEVKLLDRLSWIDDQTGNYIRSVLKIQKKDKTIGEFLKWKCLYGLTDKEISEKFRKTILEMGGAKNPNDLFVEFRGRKPTIDALMRKMGFN